jgi:predicted enzyme related to lactoylglutathione lyase
MNNSITWFEIPTRDMDKAVRFYEKTFAVALKRELFGGLPHAIFPVEKSETSVTGAIVAAPHLVPAAAGVVIYLAAADGVKATLARAKAAGGTEVMPHTSIGPMGWIAIVRDVDGNNVGLHSQAE